MFTTPSGFSPHLACAEPGEEEEAPQEGPGPGACLADGPPITSASLDTLIQNLVPTADYYPEVNRYVLKSLHCSLLNSSVSPLQFIVVTVLPVIRHQSAALLPLITESRSVFIDVVV